MAKLSFAAYARHRGVTAGAVSRAVKSGRISTEIDPATGRRVIDDAAADAAWAANVDESKAIGARAAGAVNAGAVRAAPVDNSDDEADDDEAEDGDGDDLDFPNYTRARAKRETYNAELARLKYEHALGTLVLASDVKKAAFDTARVVREALLNLPDRLAAPLAGETDATRIHELLRAELVQVLEGLSGG